MKLCNVTFQCQLLEGAAPYFNTVQFQHFLFDTFVCTFTSKSVNDVSLLIVAGIGANQYDKQFVVLFSLTMAQLKQVSVKFLSIAMNILYCICFWASLD